MLFSLGGMFQHLWSLPISMSLTRPNHRTNNQVCSTLIPHTHTSHTHTHTHNTQTHTNNTCIPCFTHTHMQHMYTTLHTHTQAQYRDTQHMHFTHIQTHIQNMYTHFTHTHAHMHTCTDWFLLEDRDPVFLVLISQSLPQAGPGTW